MGWEVLITAFMNRSLLFKLLSAKDSTQCNLFVDMVFRVNLKIFGLISHDSAVFQEKLHHQR